MHTETFGRIMLDRARIDRFVAAEDRDYDLVRAVAKKAEQVSLYRLSC
jgi:hypothetical protein